MRPAVGRPAIAVLVAIAAPAARAQEALAVERPDGSRGACEARTRDYGTPTGYACERRTLALAPRAVLRVDGGMNGGAHVRGVDTVRAPQVVAEVVARAESDAEASRLAAQVQLVDDGGTLRARGPQASDRRAWWSVSWHVVVPRRTGVELRTSNGGARVAGVMGRVQVETENGGVTLDSVGGSVRARTANGGLRVALAGRAWDAAGLADAGLDAHSNNGGVTLRLPADYSARVSVATNNGRLAVEFPITVQGRVDPRRLDFVLGGGGAPVRVTTATAACGSAASSDAPSGHVTPRDVTSSDVTRRDGAPPAPQGEGRGTRAGTPRARAAAAAAETSVATGAGVATHTTSGRAGCERRSMASSGPSMRRCATSVSGTSSRTSRPPRRPRKSTRRSVTTSSPPAARVRPATVKRGRPPPNASTTRRPTVTVLPGGAGGAGSHSEARDASASVSPPGTGTGRTVKASGMAGRPPRSQRAPIPTSAPRSTRPSSQKQARSRARETSMAARRIARPGRHPTPPA
jgi:hypothetical protein